MEIRYADKGIFNELKNSTIFEDIVIGRKGAILVECDKDNNIPVVRSTTIYKNGPRCVEDIHRKLCNEIFNNAMIEWYDSNYRTMKYHSDLAIDLVPDSRICIYSSYPKYEDKRRTLMIKNKMTGEVYEIELADGSIVSFDIEFNKQHVHKIIGSAEWIGITYRLSHTYSKNLRIADESEKREFLNLRRLENKEVDFTWKKLDYTINEGDLLPVQVNPLS